MVMFTRHSGGSIIIASFVVAFFLTIIPMPDWLVRFRPEWVALILIYWCFALPERIGVGTAWVAGIFLDVLRGALFGQHALSLVIIAYLAVLLHQRVRVYPVWQQALSVLVLITLYQLLILWVNGIAGKPTSSWAYWLPSLSSTLLWPAIYIILRGVRRGFHVT